MQAPLIRTVFLPQPPRVVTTSMCRPVSSSCFPGWGRCPLIISALSWGKLLTVGGKGENTPSYPRISTKGNAGMSCVDWAWSSDLLSFLFTRVLPVVFESSCLCDCGCRLGAGQRLLRIMGLEWKVAGADCLFLGKFFNNSFCCPLLRQTEKLAWSLQINHLEDYLRSHHVPHSHCFQTSPALPSSCLAHMAHRFDLVM